LKGRGEIVKGKGKIADREKYLKGRGKIDEGKGMNS
jgi:hypothetical protein